MRERITGDRVVTDQGAPDEGPHGDVEDETVDYGTPPAPAPITEIHDEDTVTLSVAAFRHLQDLAVIGERHQPLVQVVRTTRRLATYAELAVVLDEMPVVCREVRRLHGWTTRDLGDAAGLSSSTISRVESGLPINSSTIAKILRVFATSQEGTNA